MCPECLCLGRAALSSSARMQFAASEPWSSAFGGSVAGGCWVDRLFTAHLVAIHYFLTQLFDFIRTFIFCNRLYLHDMHVIACYIVFSRYCMAPGLHLKDKVGNENTFQHRNPAFIAIQAIRALCPTCRLFGPCSRPLAWAQRPRARRRRLQAFALHGRQLEKHQPMRAHRAPGPARRSAWSRLAILRAWVGAVPAPTST